MSEKESASDIDQINKSLKHGWELLTVAQMKEKDQAFHPEFATAGQARDGHYYYKSTRHQACIQKWIPYEIDTVCLKKAAEAHATSKSHNLTFNSQTKVYSGEGSSGIFDLPFSLCLPEHLGDSMLVSLNDHVHSLELIDFKRLRDSIDTPTPFLRTNIRFHRMTSDCFRDLKKQTAAAVQRASATSAVGDETEEQMKERVMKEEQETYLVENQRAEKERQFRQQARQAMTNVSSGEHHKAGESVEKLSTAGNHDLKKQTAAAVQRASATSAVGDETEEQMKERVMKEEQETYLVENQRAEKERQFRQQARQAMTNVSSGEHHKAGESVEKLSTAGNHDLKKQTAAAVQRASATSAVGDETEEQMKERVMKEEQETYLVENQRAEKERQFRQQARQAMTNVSSGEHHKAGESVEKLSTAGNCSKIYVKCAKNFLDVQQERHSSWLFGGLAELIHNAHDHGKAKELHIKVFHDNNHNEDVLEILDKGVGMPAHVVSEQLFSFGKDYDTSKREEGSGIGQYGVGFKQGSVRVASTVVVLTKQASEGTVSVGIICNRPFEEEEQMFVFENATLTLPSYRGGDEQQQKRYEKVASLIQRWSFLTRECLSSEVEKRWRADESGTAIFLQHWRQGSDKLVVDRKNCDLRLVNQLTQMPFRQAIRAGNVEEGQEVEMDCSLVLLSFLFFEKKFRYKIVLYFS